MPFDSSWAWVDVVDRRPRKADPHCPQNLNGLSAHVHPLHPPDWQQRYLRPSPLPRLCGRWPPMSDGTREAPGLAADLG
eukprot:1416269-Pyramimonas_sp.AAC.1